jgi:hypothetical protein
MNLNLEDIKNAEPTNIDPDSLPDTDYIIEDVLKIKDLLKKHRNQEINTNLNERKFQMKLDRDFYKLKSEFPTIYEKTCNGSLETDRLIFMLKMQNEIRKKKVTSHEASVTVGQELVDNIVKPHLK